MKIEELIGEIGKELCNIHSLVASLRFNLLDYVSSYDSTRRSTLIFYMWQNTQRISEKLDMLFNMINEERLTGCLRKER